MLWFQVRVLRSLGRKKFDLWARFFASKYSRFSASVRFIKIKKSFPRRSNKFLQNSWFYVVIDGYTALERFVTNLSEMFRKSINFASRITPRFRIFF